MSVFASLLPYMYAIIALPIIMVSKKSSTVDVVLCFYCVLTVIGMIYSIFALLGSGTDSIFLGHNYDDGNHSSVFFCRGRT